MQNGDNLSALGQNLPLSAKASSPGLAVFHQTGRGLFQVTATGTGISTFNNRLLMRDNGATLQAIHRTGTAIPILGGASISKFVDVLGSHDQDLVTVHYQLRSGGSVTASNDTGLLHMNHSGSISPVIAAREDSSAVTFGLTGTLGQITRTSSGHGVRSCFIAALKPTGSAVCGFANNGSLFYNLAQSGTPAPGAGGASFKTFTSLTGGGTNVVYKATLTGPTAENEGLWRNSSILLRKGADVNNALYGPVKISKITRIWAANNDATQVLVQCTLSGTGVTTSNNQALVLSQATNGNTILMRTGTDPASLSPVARGISNATIKSFSAVDVNPATGRYTVLTTLNGSPASSNQALWTGHTQTGNDTTERTLREPTLRLRKGERYTSGKTVLGSIKGISITPAPDASGSGSGGHSHCIGAAGQVAATITADRNITEVVLLP